MRISGPTGVSARTALTLIGGASLAALAGTLLAARLARATPQGPTVAALTYAGTLRQDGQPMQGQQQLTFTFKHGATALCSPVVVVTPDSTTGEFNALIPVDQCPASLFDGTDVVVDVSLGGTVVAAAQRIDAVPYAKYADKVGWSDCPVGYQRDSSVTTFVQCLRGYDEVVEVGRGAEAFWIDRYEASIWDSFDSPFMQYGNIGDNYPGTFPDTGQWTTALYAISRKGVTPSTTLTWFQANEACRASGKRLPTGAEWIEAGLGTVDPGSSSGSNGSCRTTDCGHPPRATGDGNNCRSRWGAEDMIGNLWEMTDDWFAAIGDGSATSFPWPSSGVTGSFGNDETWNVTGHVYAPSASGAGCPAMAMHGGYVCDNDHGGTYSLSLNVSPAGGGGGDGFRCVIPGR